MSMGKLFQKWMEQKLEESNFNNKRIIGKKKKKKDMMKRKQLKVEGI